MAFPSTIAGRMTLASAEVSRSPDATLRLRNALAAETVDGLEQEGPELRFRHRSGWHSTPRPGGNHWLFDGIERGHFSVRETATALAVDYELSVAKGFTLFLSLTCGIDVSIYLFGKAQPMWLPMFSIVFLLLWLLTYLRKAKQFRKWLRAVLTEQAPPAPAPLSVPSVS